MAQPPADTIIDQLRKDMGALFGATIKGLEQDVAAEIAARGATSDPGMITALTKEMIEQLVAQLKRALLPV